MEEGEEQGKFGKEEKRGKRGEIGENRGSKIDWKFEAPQ